MTYRAASATTRPRVFVQGTAHVTGSSDSPESLHELVFASARAALHDAGLTRDDVDGVVLAAADELDGRAISSMLLAAPAGGYLRDEIKVSTESSLGLAAAAMKLEAGVGRRTLVVSWTKSSESPVDAALGVNAEPILARPAGLHPAVVEAAQCGMFAHRHGLDPDAVDELADRLARSAGHDAGSRAPRFWPLRDHHVPPATDGAVAVVLGTDESAIALDGWAFSSTHPDPTRRPHVEQTVGELVTRAFGGTVPEPDDDLVVETTDRNAYRLCMSVAALGLVPAARSAETLATGGLPNVNLSGGLWASNPFAAAGLERVVHAVSHLRSRPGANAIAHSSYDMGGQGQFVAVLRSCS